jgi:hypothetical protein
MHFVHAYLRKANVEIRRIVDPSISQSIHLAMARMSNFAPHASAMIKPCNASM